MQNNVNINLHDFYFIPIKNAATAFQQTNSVARSPQVNYTNWATATCQQNLVPTFVDRGVSHGQRGGFHTAVNVSFLDWSRYFSFK
jgi:hypothetical protein